MKKFTTIIATTILILTLIVLGIYHFSFPVHANHSNLEVSLNEWFNRGNEVEHKYNISLYDSIELGHRTYVAFEADENIGFVRLEKSFTGRFKITGSYSGSSNIESRDLGEDGQRYMLLIGRNETGIIAKASVALNENNKYEIEIPKGKVFFITTKIANGLESYDAIYEDLKFFDHNEKDITMQVAY